MIFPYFGKLNGCTISLHFSPFVCDVPPWICKHVPVHLMLDAGSARTNKETMEAQAILANEKASKGPEANENPRG